MKQKYCINYTFIYSRGWRQHSGSKPVRASPLVVCSTERSAGWTSTGQLISTLRCSLHRWTHLEQRRPLKITQEFHSRRGRESLSSSRSVSPISSSEQIIALQCPYWTTNNQLAWLSVKSWWRYSLVCFTRNISKGHETLHRNLSFLSDRYFYNTQTYSV